MTPNDMQLIAGHIDSRFDLKAMAHVNERSEKPFEPSVTEYPDMRSIPDLGIAAGGDYGWGPRYVLIDRSKSLTPSVKRINTNLYVARMSAANDHEAVDVMAAGLFKEDAIIMGEILSQMSSKESERIMRAMRAAFKKHCPAKARGDWIGPEALDLFHSGYRLTPSYNNAKPELIDTQAHEIEYLK